MTNLLLLLNERKPTCSYFSLERVLTKEWSNERLLECKNSSLKVKYCIELISLVMIVLYYNIIQGRMTGRPVLCYVDIASEFFFLCICPSNWMY